MKFINKTLGILSMMSGMLIGFSGCTEEVDYTPAEKLNGAQIYFPTTMASQIDLSNTETSFIVEVSRANTDSDITANLNVTNESGLFTIPTSVNFAAGESTAKLSIGYDPEALGFDNYQTITIAIADETYTTPYGTSTYTFKAGIPAPWTSLGTATFYDNFLFMNSYEVEIQQNDLDPSTYRLVDPYSEGLAAEGYPTEGAQSEYVEFKLLKPGDKLNDITITMEGLVYFPAYCTGFYNTSNDYNQNVDAHHPSDFTDFQDEAYWTYSKVIQSQADGSPAIVQLAPFYYMNGIGGWDYSTTDNMVRIIFPGTTATDYSVNVTYAGSYTDPNGYNYALVDVTLGSDVKEARVAMARADVDLNSIVSGLVEGSIEYVSATENGQIKLQSGGNGTYNIVAVTFGADASGAVSAQEAVYTTCIHKATTISPIDAYVGTWVLTGADSEGQFNTPVTISKADDETLVVSGAYPVEGYDDSFYLMYDAESGYVILPPQQVANLIDNVQTLLVPFNMNESLLTTEETLTGQLDENNCLSFGNTYGNEGTWDSFAYILNSAEGLQLISYYSPYLMPYDVAAQTRSFKTNKTLREIASGMKFVKAVEKKTVKSDKQILPIRSLNKPTNQQPLNDVTLR